MPVLAAGILLYRRFDDSFEVLLIHPGGPYYKNKDEGIWSVPKGIIDPSADLLTNALREFEEETGMQPEGPFVLLPEVKYGSGKRLTVYACEGDLEVSMLHSNLFEMEWPPKSGKMCSFPEADRGAWYLPKKALEKMLPAQRSLISALENHLKNKPVT